MKNRAIRIGLFVLAGFIVGSLILGTNKGNPFFDNLLYGLWTGAIAGVVVGLLVFGVQKVRSRR